MKVYVISHINFSDTYVYGVVENEETAKEIVKRLGGYFSYKEFDTENISMDREYWFYAWFCEERLGFIYIDEYADEYTFDGYEKINDKCYCKEVDEYFSCFVKTKNEELAKKIAYDMRAEYLAKKKGVL